MRGLHQETSHAPRHTCNSCLLHRLRAVIRWPPVQRWHLQRLQRIRHMQPSRRRAAVVSDKLPDTIETVDADEGKTRLIFGFDGQPPIEVLLDQPRLLGLISRLHQKIASGPLTSASVERLRPGAELRPVGQSFGRSARGFLQIELLVEMDDRFVSIPLELDPPSFEILKDAVNRHD